MIERRLIVLLMALSLAAVAGCAETRRYNVEVLNRTQAPLTIGLAKQGPPFEAHLASPEQAAVGTPSSDETLWPSTVVEPGKVGYTRIEGKFDKRSVLELRVYAGKRGLSDVLAVPRGAGDRIDTTLAPEPSRNKFVVARENGRLAATAVERIPEAAASSK